MPLRSSIFWAYLGQISSAVAALIAAMVLARILTPHQLGIFAIAFAFAGLLQAMGPLGLTSYVIREKHLSDETVASASTLNGIVGLSFALLLFVLSWVPELVFGDPEAGPVLRVLSLLPILNALSFRPMAILQREMRFKRVALIAATSACLGAVISIVLALAGQSYMSPAYGTVAATGLSSVAYNLANPNQLAARISFAQWKTIAWFGFRVTSVSGVALFAGRANEILIGRLLGLGSLGLYTRATTLANPMWDGLYGAATRVLYARMAEDMRTTGEIHTTFLRGLENITAIMWPFLLGLALLSGPAILILFGQAWLPAAAPLSILLISQVIAMCFGMNWELFVIRDEIAKQTRIEIIRSVIWVAACLIGCRFGLIGAAFASIVASSAGLVMYMPHVSRLSGIPKNALLAIYRRSAILTLAAVLPSWVLMIIYEWSSHAPLIWIVAVVALGVACWGAALCWLKHPLWTGIKALLQSEGKTQAHSGTAN